MIPLLVASILAPAPDILDFVQKDLRDARFLASKVRASQKELAKINDDFGTSYSSLANLPRYGISRIKIDRSFVKNIQSQSSHPVINAIAGVARGFDIQLTAEGVERGDQRSALETLGCDEMQGFLFSRPLDAAAAGELLAGFRPSRLPAGTA